MRDTRYGTVAPIGGPSSCILQPASRNVWVILIGPSFNEFSRKSPRIISVSSSLIESEVLPSITRKSGDQPEKLPQHVKDLNFDPYRSLAWIVRDRHGYLKNDAPFSEFKWANFFRTRILLDQDILAGKHTVDDFLFSVDKHGELMLTDDGKEVIDEAMFLAASAEARGLPGFRGNIF